MEITIRSDVLVCPVPKSYVGMQSCIPKMIWWWCSGSANLFLDEVLGSKPQAWLNGLASSHVLHLTLSGAPKILLYCTEYRRPTTLAPTNEESWAQWGKNLMGEKNNLTIESSEVYMWLVWILTTKRTVFLSYLILLDLIFKMVFTLWIYMYISL